MMNSESSFVAHKKRALPPILTSAVVSNSAVPPPPPMSSLSSPSSCCSSTRTTLLNRGGVSFQRRGPKEVEANRPLLICAAYSADDDADDLEQRRLRRQSRLRHCFSSSPMAAIEKAIRVRKFIKSND